MNIVYRWHPYSLVTTANKMQKAVVWLCTHADIKNNYMYSHNKTTTGKKKKKNLNESLICK